MRLSLDVTAKISDEMQRTNSIFSFFDYQGEIYHYITYNVDQPKLPEIKASELVSKLKDISDRLAQYLNYLRTLKNKDKLKDFTVAKNNLLSLITIEGDINNYKHYNRENIDEFNIYPGLYEFYFDLRKKLYNMLGSIELKRALNDKMLLDQIALDTTYRHVLKILSRIEVIGIDGLTDKIDSDETIRFEKIRLKAEISIAGMFLVDNNVQHIPEKIFDNYQIVDCEVNEDEAELRYLPYINAVKLAKTLFASLTKEDRLFNIYSFINSKITNTEIGESRFVFAGENNFTKTEKDLSKCFPRFIVCFSSDKLYKYNKINGFSDHNKLLFINSEDLYSKDDNKFTLSIFLVICHEISHIKRMGFASCCIGHHSPYIKFISSDVKCMDIGFFLEKLLLVSLFC
jgi:hypothetical protein